MSSTKASKPRKRRSRPQPLTRAHVLKEGLEILDRDGLGALNMRRLAERLRVSPMALYNHVRDKQDLLEAIVEMVVDEVQYHCDSDDWREHILMCFPQLRKACLAHPSVIRLVESTEALPASIFRPMEITLAALRWAGAGPQDSLRAYFLLMNFTMGQVSYEVRGPFRGLDAAQAVQQGKLSPVAFPASSAAEQATAPYAWDFDAAFEFGLSIILAGLESFARGK